MSFFSKRPRPSAERHPGGPLPHFQAPRALPQGLGELRIPLRVLPGRLRVERHELGADGCSSNSSTSSASSALARASAAAASPPLPPGKRRAVEPVELWAADAVLELVVEHPGAFSGPLVDLVPFPFVAKPLLRPQKLCCPARPGFRHSRFQKLPACFLRRAELPQRKPGLDRRDNDRHVGLPARSSGTKGHFGARRGSLEGRGALSSRSGRRG